MKSVKKAAAKLADAKRHKQAESGHHRSASARAPWRMPLIQLRKLNSATRAAS
jgi:hypothetical protein